MNEAISKYQKRDNDFIILDNRNRKKFLDELQDGEIYVEILQKKSKLRTYLQNRYLWGGVYSEFVKNGNWDRAEFAHHYFTHKYLCHTDTFGKEDTEFMQKQLSKAREILSYRTYYVFKGMEKESKLEVVWIQSTASLSTKEFNNYIEAIKIEAAELGLHIKEPEEFY